MGTLNKIFLHKSRFLIAMAAEKLHVGVIGAGVSGLRCADVLLSHGFRVTILEARSRIGGRVSRHHTFFSFFLFFFFICGGLRVLGLTSYSL